MRFPGIGQRVRIFFPVTPEGFMVGPCVVMRGGHGPGGSGNGQRRLTMATVDKVPYKFRARDLTAEILGFKSSAAPEPGNGFGLKAVTDAVKKSRAAFQALHQRHARLIAAHAQIQSGLKTMLSGMGTEEIGEQQIFSCLTAALEAAELGRVLVYRRYGEGEQARDGSSAAEGSIHAVAGGTLNPKETNYPPHQPPKVPPKDELWGITLEDAGRSGDKQVLAQIVEDPLRDPRCNLQKVKQGIKAGDHRYSDPHLTVPLIDVNGRRWGFIVVWVEEREVREKFDALSVGLFVNIASTVMSGLSAIETRKQQQALTAAEQTSLPARILVPGRWENAVTDDGRFNPKLVPPGTPGEYHEMMSYLLGQGRRFGEDDAALEDLRAFRRAHMTLRRRDPTGRMRHFNAYLLKASSAPRAEVLSRPVARRLVFEWDLLSQRAALDAYAQQGVTYDPRLYYRNRYLPATHKLFILEDDMPVAFSVLTTAYAAILEPENMRIPYIFIQAIMSMGSRLKGMGITTYAVRELLSSIWLSNLVKGIRNGVLGGGFNGDMSAVLLDPETEELVTQLSDIWIGAHSGRASVYHLFVTRFRVSGFAEGRLPDRIKEAVIADQHRRITPPEELKDRPVDWATFRDPGVYPPENRYPVGEDGRVIIPPEERENSTFPQWWEAIGGEEGIRSGNALHYAGLLTRGKLRTEKKRQRNYKGEPALLRVVDFVRKIMVGRGKRK